VKQRSKGKLVCAWCNKFMAIVYDFTGVTHGCCDDCARKFKDKKNGLARQDATARLQTR